MLVAGSASGQSNVGRISGTVTDMSGLAVPGSKVEAVNVSTGISQSVQTDDGGLYVFASLPAGAYNLIIERPGFRRSEQRGVVLDASSQRSIDFKLEVGAVSEAVAVSATAQQVQTNSGEVGSVLNDRQVSQIALNGQNYGQLLRLLPGVMAMDTNPFGMQLSTTTQRANGVRTMSIEFMVDGTRNFDPGVAINQVLNPIVDTIAEVRVSRSSYSAENAGRSGASVNVVGKTGTNAFHGSLFEFLRNDAFDARSFFATRVEKLRFNDIGGTVGGPVFIPKKWNTNKEKAFFFVGREWKHTHQSTTNVNLVPTLAEREGNFQSSTLAAPVDPTSKTPYPNRTVPASVWSHNGPLMLAVYPAPNFAGPGGNYVFPGMNIFDPSSLMVRSDYYFSPKLQLAYRWASSSNKVVQPFGGGPLGIGPGSRNRPGSLESLSFSDTISPTTLNYFTFSSTTDRIHGDIIGAQQSEAVTGVNVPLVFPSNRSKIMPQMIVAGFASITTYDRNQGNNEYLMWRDDFTKVMGPHTLKVGAQIARGDHTQDTKAHDEGTATFNTSALRTSGNAIADVLLGNFQTFAQDEKDTYYYLRITEREFYAQDSWKVTRRFNVELGLRYSVWPPYVNIQGNTGTFAPNLYNPANAPVVSRADGTIAANTGVPYNGISFFGSSFPSWAKGRLAQYGVTSLQSLFHGLPQGGSNTNLNDWAPRLGLAYDPFGTGKTAIRAGFGLFYDHIGSDYNMNLSAMPPFQNSASIFNGNIDNPAGGASNAVPPNLALWPLRIKDPSMMTWNFGVQQELPGNIIVDANYVGNVGRHLQRNLNENQLALGTLLGTNSTANPNALRRYLGYANITAFDNGDNSSYNALQVAVNRRVGKGVSFGVSYSFSRTLDTSGGGSNGISAPQNSYLANADYGLSDIHRKNVLNFNYIYELPFFARYSNPVVRKALGGWEVAGVTSFQSGAPYSVTVPKDVAGIGVASTRASVNGDPNLASDQRTLTRWFNAAVFLLPAQMTPGQFGNIGRNILIGPGFEEWDLSLIKNFSFANEKVHFQFRAEAFNILNHANFSSIGTSATFSASGAPSGTFGAVTGAGPGRTLEFGLKFWF
jgi:hypothetical protein